MEKIATRNMFYDEKWKACTHQKKNVKQFLVEYKVSKAEYGDYRKACCRVGETDRRNGG